MSLKLLTEHHLEFLSFKEGCTGSSECTLVKISHCWKSHVAGHLVLFSVPSSAHLLALVDENGSLVIYNTNRYGEDALLKGTVLPAKSDSDVMFCLIVIRNLESIDHLCINPIAVF